MSRLKRISGGAPAAAGSVDLRHVIAIAASVLLIALASCAPATTATPTPVSTGGTPATAHAPEIRFALIGNVTDANVWALFDSKGYSYNNYAIRSGYWPRLYDLSIPDNQFESLTASGMPSPVRQEGAFFASTIPLRSDLTWTDGTPFTADDVAFTVNTALAFRLGFDWQDYYNPAWLDHAEALDPHTVKFLFRQQPNVAVWQYGALQGPVVQNKYWSTGVAGAAALLPSSELIPQIDALKSKVADLQKQVDALNASTFTTYGEEARQVQSGLKRQQGDLDKAINDLAKAQAGYEAALDAARAALYALNDAGEPRLGGWTPAGSQGGSSADSSFKNLANPGFPGAAPNFDSAVYRTYATREAANAALQRGEVDVILDATPSPEANDAPHAMTSPTRSVRFLALNLLSEPLKEVPLRQALACMIDQDALIAVLEGRAAPLKSFVLPEERFWYNTDATLPCNGLDPAGRLTQATQILKAAGYTWAQEPSAQASGEGLASPGGTALPSLQILAPTSDELRATAAAYVQQQARELGIPLTVQTVTQDAIDYAVLSSHRYELAVVGWRISPYPSYLCDWFAVGQALHYDPSRLTSDCGELAAASELEAARQHVYDIQSVLTQDVPMIPLYSGVTQEALGKVTYPFAQVLDGLSGIYGAPALAGPASP